MVSAFFNPRVGSASELGIGLFEDMAPVELRSGSSGTDIDTVIRAAYRQVFGNAHIMDSERITMAESGLRYGSHSVRKFVRELAQSNLYRSWFHDNCSRYRFIELNFKHLLGRAPHSYEEIAIHSQILDAAGYEAEIDSYLNSEEYLFTFGESIVPYYRGYKTQGNSGAVGFTHLFQLLRGSASSDKDVLQRNRARLQKALFTNHPSSVQFPLGVTGYRTDRDVKQLIQDAVKSQSESQVIYAQTVAQAEARRALQSRLQEQVKRLEQMQGQLADIQSYALVGAALGSKWRTYGALPVSDALSPVAKPPVALTGVSSLAGGSDSLEALQQQVEAQEEEIARIQKKIAELQGLALLAQGRLSSWTTRTFSVTR